MHGEWTPHAHLNKDVSEVFVSHRGGAREKRFAPKGRSKKKSQFARIERRQELQYRAGVPCVSL